LPTLAGNSAGTADFVSREALVESGRLPDYLCGVLVQQPVRGQDGDVFFQRLGDEEAIERISVEHREGFEANDMLDPDGQ
jgi:hypothetical protein